MFRVRDVTSIHQSVLIPRTYLHPALLRSTALDGLLIAFAHGCNSELRLTLMFTNDTFIQLTLAKSLHVPIEAQHTKSAGVDSIWAVKILQLLR